VSRKGCFALSTNSNVLLMSQARTTTSHGAQCLDRSATPAEQWDSFLSKRLVTNVRGCSAAMLHWLLLLRVLTMAAICTKMFWCLIKMRSVQVYQKSITRRIPDYVSD